MSRAGHETFDNEAVAVRMGAKIWCHWRVVCVVPRFGWLGWPACRFAVAAGHPRSQTCLSPKGRDGRFSRGRRFGGPGARNRVKASRAVFQNDRLIGRCEFWPDGSALACGALHATLP